MMVNEVLDEIREALAEDELTPLFVKVSLAVTGAFLITFGVIAYIIVFIILGY